MFADAAEEERSPAVTGRSSSCEATAPGDSRRGSGRAGQRLGGPWTPAQLRPGQCGASWGCVSLGTAGCSASLPLPCPPLGSSNNGAAPGERGRKNGRRGIKRKMQGSVRHREEGAGESRRSSCSLLQLRCRCCPPVRCCLRSGRMPLSRN